MSQSAREESDYYAIIKTKIEEVMKNKFKESYLEITSKRKFSKKLKHEIALTNRDIIFYFLQNTAPDITGFVKDEFSTYFFIAEIKREKIQLGDIYQTRKYSELFNAKYSFLISTEEIPEEIIKLSKVVFSLLNGGHGYDRITLVHYDPDKENFIEWFEKNPFEK
jgi:hypothetical protein